MSYIAGNERPSKRHRPDDVKGVYKILIKSMVKYSASVKYCATVASFYEEIHLHTSVNGNASLRHTCLWHMIYKPITDAQGKRMVYLQLVLYLVMCVSVSKV